MARDHEGADHGGDQPKPHLGQREGHTLGGKRDIAGADQPDAAAISRPLNQRHGRLGQPAQYHEEARERLGIGDVLGLREIPAAFFMCARSAPAQKDFPRPARTTTLTSSLAPRSPSASVSRAISASSKAL